ncbi:MAG: aminodeoxychorismate synthase component I [Deltaproteobacteria bacterium]|jgi:para-aminobenzoate synthetase component 1|nr:aminodeoxychorismate synthase component I [Deltaproteobacteria bacterium]
MEFVKPEIVRQTMNDLGRERRPFLFAVDFELTEGFVVPEPQSGAGVFFSVHGQGHGLGPRPAPAKGEAWIEARPESLAEYKKKFGIVQAGLARGDSFLVNLTIKTPVECPLSLEEIFSLSDAPYGLCVPGRFVSFSPETFVKIEPGGTVSTYPMKGTINADIPGAEKIIMDDFKEAAEHATVVDLLRNDLSLSAKKVRVKRYRYVELLKTSRREILQVSSEIVGELGEGFHRSIGDVIFKMLPAGSVSGAPKESTLDIIRRSEGIPRGFYAGVFGLYDGNRFDSGVLIRFVEEENGQKFFRSGGGITALSLLEDEYNEALDKIYLPFAPKKAVAV